MDIFDETVLEPALQLQWTYWLREETKNIKQTAKARGRYVYHEQILGEDYYATLEKQCQYYDDVLSLVCIAAWMLEKELERQERNLNHLQKFYMAESKHSRALTKTVIISQSKDIGLSY